MSKTQQNCFYHPSKAAHWQCNDCENSFCPSCVIKKGKPGLAGTTRHVCPKCRSNLEWIGAANTIEPFWKKTGAMFCYPFSAIPLVLILTTSLFEIVASVSLFGGLASLLTTIIILKYSFAALQRTARGTLTPPPSDYETICSDIGPVIKQFFLYIILGILCFFLFTATGPFLAGLMLVLSVLCLPAMIILLVVNESLLDALNPANIFRLISRIGKGYAIMFFFLFLLGSAPAALSTLLPSLLPAFLQSLLASMAQKYYILVSYFLMGYVLLQYHRQIGYEVHFEHFAVPAAVPAGSKNENELLNRIDVLVKESQFEEALRLIRAKVNVMHMTDLELAERYYNLLLLTKKTPELLDHSSNYLNLLVQGAKRKKACEVFHSCREHGTSFRPDPASLHTVGQWLREDGNAREALYAFDLLIKTAPQDPLVPDSYFKAAQLLNSEFSNPARAKTILEALVKKFPRHEIIPFVQRYLAGLDPAE